MAPTVLLVEDQESVRRLAARVLAGAGYRVLEAASGEEALEIAGDGQSLDLVVTDVVMPGIDGGELARRIAGRHQSLPIILMSGYPGDANTLDRIGGGRGAFLQKPFTPKDLLAAVEKALGAPHNP